MNVRMRLLLAVPLLLLAGIALVLVSRAAPEDASPAQGGAPGRVAYQGEVRVLGQPFNGTGYFKFAVIGPPGPSTFWSNDGSSVYGMEPAAAVPLSVTQGLFSVLLGDTSQPGMTEELAAGVFDQPDRSLRVWFSATGEGGDFVHLIPDTSIAAVPYALQAQQAVNADTLDGLHAHELAAEYENVVIVAKSGGHYDSVQAAIDSIGDAAADNAYLVWVAPGVYLEQVTMKPHVHLQGAGQATTVISNTTPTGSPPTQGAVTLASHTSLRDLAVVNSGASILNAALLATAGTTGAYLHDVSAQALGHGESNYGVYVYGSGALVTLNGVTALGENATQSNRGLSLGAGGAAVLHAGSFTARSGANARAISNDINCRFEATSITALAENGSDQNYGLYNRSEALLRGGSYAGRGGTSAVGIVNITSGAVLMAFDVNALGEDAGSSSYGLHGSLGATATLHGGSFAGRLGPNARGIYNENEGTMLETDGSTVTGEGGTVENYALYNSYAAAELSGGFFYARGGTDAQAIFNFGGSATLVAEDLRAMAEDATDHNYGLINRVGAVALARRSSFTALGGAHAWGMYNYGSGATLEADAVVALGTDGSSNNYGLFNYSDGVATLRGGSYIGRGGTGASGIFNWSANEPLRAEDVRALGELATSSNIGLTNAGDTPAILMGGSYAGRGGETATGIYSYSRGELLRAQGISALGENATTTNTGLHSVADTPVSLAGGSFTGRGGVWAYGIDNEGNLQAEAIVAQAESASSSNIGLYNGDGGSCHLQGGSFAGRGGDTARGISNWASPSGAGAQMTAKSVNALAVEADTNNWGVTNYTAALTITQSVLEGASYSVYVTTGSVTVSNSRLVGVSWGAEGTLSCILVTRGSTISTDGTTCP